MTGRQWTRSGKGSSTSSGVSARPFGSWAAAVDRARRSWDELAGGPAELVEVGELDGVSSAARVRDGRYFTARYSDAAAAAILRTALGLWADVAAGMAEGDPAE